MKYNERSFAEEQFSVGLKFSATDVDLEKGTFVGRASVFGSLVNAFIPTIIEKGAFIKTLAENGKRIRILYQHNIDEPIGKPTELRESDFGLEITGQVSNTTRGKDALTLMRDGVIDELSIGFDPIKYNMVEEDHDGVKQWIRYIKELRLWEISLVTFGADQMAKIYAVHSIVPFQDLPLADEGLAWDASAADKRIRTWAGGSDDIADMDWTKYRRAHVWYDAKDSEKVGSYKLLIADIIDGKLTAVPRGVFAAAVVLQGGRGGVNIPEDEKTKAKVHLGRYYKKMDRTAPWDEEKQELRILLEPFISASIEMHKGAVLSAKNRDLIKRAVTVLEELLAAAEPPVKEEDKALTEQIERFHNLELALLNAQLGASCAT